LTRNRRLALVGIYVVVHAAVQFSALILLNTDGGWLDHALGGLALFGGPFVTAMLLKPLVPVECRRRWAPMVAASGWAGLGGFWLLAWLGVLDVVGAWANVVACACILGSPAVGAWSAIRQVGAVSTERAGP